VKVSLLISENPVRGLRDNNCSNVIVLLVNFITGSSLVLAQKIKSLFVETQLKFYL
jgi:hypothetical protein